MNATMARAIVSFGSRYREEYLRRRWTPDGLLGDSWRALDFFLAHALFQGRRDTVSQGVYVAAIEVLEPRIALVLSEDAPETRTLGDVLRERIGRGRIGKDRGVMMILDTMNFIGGLPDRNIVRHSVDRIRAGEVREHFEALQGSRNRGGITQVGPKIASLYLRDIVLLYDLEDTIPEEARSALQPVDVWVRRLCERTGAIPAGASDGEVREAILRIGRDHDCSPVLFNAGAWYAGSRSFDLFVEHLGHVPDGESPAHPGTGG